MGDVGIDVWGWFIDGEIGKGDDGKKEGEDKNGEEGKVQVD